MLVSKTKMQRLKCCLLQLAGLTCKMQNNPLKECLAKKPKLDSSSPGSYCINLVESGAAPEWISPQGTSKQHRIGPGFVALIFPLPTPPDNTVSDGAAA